MTGKFIVLEGIDGAGTTTQRDRLVSWLGLEGWLAFSTAEPSPLPVGQLIRSILNPASGPFDPEAMALLFAADRRDHLARRVKPNLQAGAVVVSDRYVLSSLAYQVAAGVPRGFVRAANFDGNGILMPDLVLFIRVPAEVAAERRAARGGREEIYDALEMQKRVAQAYEDEVQDATRRGWSCRIIDGTKNPDEVEEDVRRAVKGLLWDSI